MASTTSNAVWGRGSAPQTHEEPISGATGNVSKGEPYDAGNMDPEDQNKLQSVMETDADANTPGKQPNSAADVHASEEYEPPVAPAPAPPAAAAAALPATAAHPATTPPPATGDNEPRNIITEKASEQNLEHSHSAANATKDIPQRTETIAQQHGGLAAGPTQTVPPPSSSSEGTKESTQAGKAEKEQYFKATGLAADGGDFDAAKPGAGREADRLMEEKGMHIDKGGTGGHGGKDKPSLGERIKNKLHKH